MFVSPAWRRFYLWDCYLVFCVNIAIEVKESGANGGKFLMSVNFPRNYCGQRKLPRIKVSLSKQTRSSTMKM